jgi:nicotinate-nucleotide adenylyltransferase
MGIKLGVFGGTFNPIHIGHLRLAEDVREKFSLDRILFIPTNIPPHKKVEFGAAPIDRLRMVQIAVERNSSFLCDDVEIKRGGNSYTIDTVNYIYKKFQFEEKPFFILGSDLIPELNTWKEIHRLTGLLFFIVLLRNNYPIVGEYGNEITGFECSVFGDRNIEITSSEIRQRLRKAQSVRYLVADSVLDYIIEKRLYRDRSGD